MAVKASHSWQGTKALPHHKVTCTMTKQALIDELERMFQNGAVCYRFTEKGTKTEFGCIDIYSLDEQEEVSFYFEPDREVIEWSSGHYTTRVERMIT
ncbi:hypothetical protein [Methanohalobium sp.]|uniref:hypothetical protein n=1 Tax=Methanohalobium sp. TaxID=2837493 RepID=UPI0025EA2182|nr:hypothetical protein [Methanohalobium sp.]